MKRPIYLTVLIIISFFISQKAFGVDPVPPVPCAGVAANVSFADYKDKLATFNSSFVNNGNYCIVFSDANAVPILRNEDAVKIDVINFLGDNEYDVYIKEKPHDGAICCLKPHDGAKTA